MIVTISIKDDRIITVRDDKNTIVCKFKKGRCKLPDKKAKLVLKMVDFIHAEGDEQNEIKEDE